ncbi:hypothetical protein V2J09_017779 [Rumex salicifolius]
MAVPYSPPTNGSRMSSKADYAPLPSYSSPAASSSVPETYIVIYRNSLLPPSLRAFNRRFLSYSLSIALLFLILFLLWPSDPEVQVVRVQLNNVAIQTSPRLSLDLSLFVVARIRSRDFFSFRYESLGLSIGYRGRKLGFVSSEGGQLNARGASYVNSTLVIDGFEVFHDIFYFIEDVARGSVHFDTDTTIKGELGFLSILKIPLKAKVSCEVIVNPHNQTIVRQNCYPEVDPSCHKDPNKFVNLVSHIH